MRKVQGNTRRVETWYICAVSDGFTDNKILNEGRSIIWKLRAFHANAPCHPGGHHTVYGILVRMALVLLILQ